MKPKFLTLIALLALLLAACSGPGGQSETPANISEAVQATKLVRIGIRNDFPPVAYIDDNGSWVGFDVDMANEIAGRLGVETELVAVDETTRITFLETGRIDMAVAGMNHTRKRDAAIDFTEHYFWGGQTFLIRAGEFDKLEDLFGETVAMNTGSSAIDGWESWAVEQGGAAGDIVEFSDKQAALQALRNGEVAGYGEDEVPLLALADGDPKLVLVSGYFNPVRYGIGVPHNQSEWRDELNFVLQDMFADGTFEQIYNRWLGPGTLSPLPLDQDNLQIWP